MEKENNIIDLRRLWRAVWSLKWLCLAGVVLSLSLAIWYVGRTLPKIPIVGQVLVGEESMDDAGGATLAGKSGAGGMSQMMKTFSVGGFSAATVDNEIMVISSHDVMLRTVKNLSLNRIYTGKTEDGDRAMLYRNSPVIVEAPAEYFDTLLVAFSMKIRLLPDGKANVKAQKGFFRRTIAEAKDIELPAVFETPLGSFQLLRSDCFETSPYRTVHVGISGNSNVAINLAQQVDIDVASKLSDVISVELEYPNAELGKAIVNGIMGEYNGKRLDRIHETASNTIKYYDERIAETLSRLENAEKKVADYQRDNQLVSPASELPMLARQGFEQQQQAIIAQNSLDYYKQVLSSLRSNMNNDVLIPQVEVMGDTNIVAYNKLLLQRRVLQRSAKDGNRALVLLNERIGTMRDLIIENAEKAVAKASDDISFQRGLAGGAKSQASRFPELELSYSILARDQAFQAQLYQFLAQARENAVLKLYTDTNVGFVFQPAYCEKSGFDMKSVLIIIIALMLPIMGILCLALILMWRSNRVKAPMDVAFIGIDKHTLNDNADAALRMRTLLMASPDRRVIYTAALGAKEPVNAVIGSFRNADIPVGELTAETNSLLLSPAFVSSVKDMLTEVSYIFVTIPEPEKVFELENAIDADNAALLLGIPSTMKRKELKTILKGQTADKIFALITE